MAKSNQIGRLVTFTKKRWRAMREESPLPPAFDGPAPRVIINSVPKAGTNLAERAVQLIPGMLPAGFRTLMDWEVARPRTVRALRRLRPGRYRTAHLPFFEEYLPAVVDCNIRIIFVIRDPRDVAVSLAQYVTTNDRTHKAHKAMASLTSDDDRLLAAIHGLEGRIVPVNEVWRRYLDWFEAPNVTVIRFEELIGIQGGGGEARQRGAVIRMLSHLSIRPEQELVEHISSKVFSPEVPTFRKGSIGGWRSQFREVHKQEFKIRTGDLLVRLGYEQDVDWD